MNNYLSNILNTFNITLIDINLDEVLFFNTNGKLEKRYELENQLLAVKLYNKGNMAALVFRNKIELIKL